MNNCFKKRIDELGRIVIPKEIRNAFKIKNFDEIELSIEDNLIVLKKTAGLEKYKEKFQNLIDYLKEFIKYDLLIIDDKKVIISSNKMYKEDEEICIDLSKNFLEGYIKITKDSFYNGNVLIESLIIDSNLYGYLIILSPNIIENKDEIKKLKQVIINLID